jgi:hypothetical protein
MQQMMMQLRHANVQGNIGSARVMLLWAGCKGACALLLQLIHLRLLQGPLPSPQFISKVCYLCLTHCVSSQCAGQLVLFQQPAAKANSLTCAPLDALLLPLCCCALRWCATSARPSRLTSGTASHLCRLYALLLLLLLPLRPVVPSGGAPRACVHQG